MPTSPKKIKAYIETNAKKKLFPFDSFYSEHTEEFDSVSNP